jgi:hypothetical protein
MSEQVTTIDRSVRCREIAGDDKEWQDLVDLIRSNYD